jgi:MFS family permease
MMLHPNFILFSVIYIFLGVFDGWPLLISNTVISDIITTDDQLEAHGFLFMGNNIGWTIGSLVGGVMATSPIINFYAASFISGIMVLIIYMFIRESKPKSSVDSKVEKGFQRYFSDMSLVLHDRVFLIFITILLLLHTILSQFYALFSIYTVEFVGISTVEMGLIYAANGIILTIFSYPVLKYFKKYNILNILLAGAILYVIACIGVGVTSSLLGIFTFYSIVEAFGEIFYLPVSSTITAKIAPERHRGKYIGVMGMFQRNAFSFGPLIGGILMEIFRHNFIYFWGVFAFIGVIAVFTVLSFKKKLTD